MGHSTYLTVRWLQAEKNQGKRKKKEVLGERGVEVQPGMSYPIYEERENNPGKNIYSLLYLNRTPLE